MNIDGRVVGISPPPDLLPTLPYFVTVEDPSGQTAVLQLRWDLAADPDRSWQTSVADLLRRSLEFGLLVGLVTSGNLIVECTLTALADGPRPPIAGTVRGVVVALQVDPQRHACVWIGEDGNPFSPRLLQLRLDQQSVVERQRTRVMLDLLSAACSTGEPVSVSFGDGNLVDLSWVRLNDRHPPDARADERYAPRLHDHYYRAAADFTADDAHNDTRYLHRNLDNVASWTASDAHDDTLYPRLDLDRARQPTLPSTAFGKLQHVVDVAGPVAANFVGGRANVAFPASWGPGNRNPRVLRVTVLVGGLVVPCGVQQDDAAQRVRVAAWDMAGAAPLAGAATVEIVARLDMV